jgi:hypothetical protein
MDPYLIFIPSWKRDPRIGINQSIGLPKFEISFSWDTAVHPSQLVLATFSDDFRKRTWNISQGKYTLYEPIQEQADLPDVTAEPPTHQAFTISISTQFSNVVSVIGMYLLQEIGPFPKTISIFAFLTEDLRNIMSNKLYHPPMALHSIMGL